MSTCRAFDSDGNEVFPTQINSLCPIEYLEEAKVIAYEYFLQVEKCQATLEQMFTQFLKPIGGDKPTHVWCPRTGYTHQLKMQVGRMSELNKDWLGKRVYTLEDDHQELLNKFVCMTDDAQTILETLGLQEV
jgi:hypothetical protein